MTRVLPPESDQDAAETLQAHLHVLESEQQERLARKRAEASKLPYVSLLVTPVNPEDLALIPRAAALQAKAVLFYRHGKDVRLGIVNPGVSAAQEVVAQLATKLGTEPAVYVISEQSFSSAVARYPLPRPLDAIPADEMRLAGIPDTLAQELMHLQELGKRILSLPPSELLTTLMQGAVAVEASDVHIEPKEKLTRLRYRIDGVLQDVIDFDREGWKLLLSRIKVLTKLKLNIHEVPQDGSFVLRVGTETYDIRVSILPGVYGENIVMRLLNRAAEIIKVTDLGMKQRDYEVIRQQLKRDHGMILAVGPTGSGKTTTLAACLNYINNPDFKIITLEDPIEYRLTGVEQTQVDESAGYTFARGLRSILRQDPDVVMIGEMRDAETAEVAMQASLTGHLVFSTLHTNDAAGSVTRLVDMGIKPYIIAPAVNVVIAQRLVRIVCRHCGEKYKPEPSLLKHIRQAMAGVSKDIFNPAVLHKKDLTFKKAKGCTQCHGTGYKGRQGIFEMLVIDGEVEEMVLKGDDEPSIRAAGIDAGMTTLVQDAYLKVIDKITTIEEVERITGE